MNKLEYEMIDVLKALKETYGILAIKAEFEAEGSRMEEMMRLKDVTSYVGLPIILKIGGVEAVTDIYNALSIGVKGIVAPMVETCYAFSKYTNMIRNMVAEDNTKDIEFSFNLETKTACENLEKILYTRDMSLIKNITVGRVDLAGSLAVPREKINSSKEVHDYSKRALRQIKQLSIKIKTCLGGAICKQTLPTLDEFLGERLLDKFETRKVVFPIIACLKGEKVILKAVEFELLWLKSKRRYYSRIKVEDEKRIQMLEERLK